MLKKLPDTATRPSGTEHQPLLDAMDAAVQEAAAKQRAARNRARRISYRHRLQTIIEHPGGGTAKLTVSSRNLSTGGVAFLCEGFIHPRSICTITLITPEKETIPVPGKVAHCHLVRGRVHEIGVRFDKPIAVGCFVAPESMSLSDLAPAELQGRVLSLDASPVEQELLRHFIQGTKVALTTLQSPDEAMKVLAENRHDIFITDLYLCGSADAGLNAIADSRAAGFVGPIVLATAETIPEKHAQARLAGADYVLAKPYRPNSLIAILQRAHYDCGAILNPHLMSNAHADKSEFRHVTDVFNAEAGNYALNIRKALAAKDSPALRQACLQVKASASGVGYVNLSASAEAALAALTRSMAAARGPALRLASGCQQLNKLAAPAQPPAAQVA
jgi:CheY-like chemotaxis protein